MDMELEALLRPPESRSFYVLTRDIWNRTKARLCVGDRPVPQELLATAEAEIKIPGEEQVIEDVSGAKRRQVK